MDYEKLHQDTINKLQQMVNSGKITVEVARGICADFIPESEDERVRKALIKLVKKTGEGYENVIDGVSIENAISWLEKQGDKPNNVYDKELSEILGRVIRRYINDPNIPYTEREKVSKEIIPYVESLEKQGEQILANSAKTCKDEQKLADTDNKFIRIRENKPKDISEFLDRLTTVEQEFLWEHIAKIRELDKEKQGEQKPSDKVEPKFHEGDWVVYKCDICQIVKREEGCNKLVTNFGIEKELVNERNLSTARLWTIQDAKDGDAFVTDNGLILIYNGYLEEQQWPFAYGGINIYGKFNICNGLLPFTHQKVVPATKEQYDTLFAKMKESGYEWDAEKKELKRIEQKPTEDVDLPEFESYLCLMFQKFRTKGMCTNGEIIDYVKEHSQKLRDILVKPTWSKEDERTFSRICGIIHHAAYQNCDTDEDGNELGEYAKIINWFKSLKDKVLPKQEWSAEDEYCTHQLIVFCKNCIQPDSGAIRCAHWLKSLKDRYTWKPSDEQVNTLEQWLKDNQYKGDARYCYPIFESLYQDLKKLKG